MTKVLVNEVKPNPNERDFVANPLQIETETIGTLPKTRDEKQTAQETPFTSADFTATDVQGALEELFTLSDSNKQALIAAIGNPLLSTSTYQDIINAIITGKNDIVNSIVTKGATANNAMGLTELAIQILSIQAGTGGDNLKLTNEITATANMAYSIPISGYLMPSQSVAQVYKYNEASPSIIHYQNDFNNANASSFNYDAEQIKFDGMMQIRDTYDYDFTPVDDYFETQQIDFAAFVGFDSDAVIAEKVTLKGLKTTQAVAVASGDIPLDETLEINKVTLTAVGTVRVAMSLDSGFSWQTFDGANFVDLNISDLSDFKANGMTATTLNAITKSQWTTYRGTSNKLRFAYFIERLSVADTSGTDLIKLDANMSARWLPAHTNDYKQTFDPAAQIYNFIFVTAGKYKARYKE